MCPISPAALEAPLINLPFKIIPEPIPVPIVMQIKLSQPFPAPKFNSPNAAQRTSLSSFVGILNSSSIIFASGTLTHPGILGKFLTTPSL